MPWHDDKLTDPCPYNIRELREWAIRTYPDRTKTYWKTIKPKQLYAIWFNSNKKENKVD